ncbi:FAD:protein FMN transferase [Arthrobacter cryoconiti]|uniref:FAD:protein FMN transferase n=1 Tax=Arthrobacter cryoconiti TaxID=748907 RepID=A0ABV8R187_9MICC|nr:FAD:protein FMN transferase [Arthrobacter cryoconiti]MCC9069882.1 FAD:protein FMN transferase [Arthrobacter cryoconiti]
MSGQSSWTAWGIKVSLTVTDPALVRASEKLVRVVIEEIDEACSGFRADSELARIRPQLSQGARISPQLSVLIVSALNAAQWSDGDVDPTLGNELRALGYDRDISEVTIYSPALTERSDDAAVAAISSRTTVPVAAFSRIPGWSRVRFEEGILTVPEDLLLDLGATAKAVAADQAAARVFAALGCGALVSLGGDIATSGPAPEGGWQVLVQDLAADPWQQVTLGAGFAVATSSTQKRRWQRAGTSVHHILDPRFGLPAESIWRSVTVAAPSCLRANVYSTAGIVRGFAAVEWFQHDGVAARLIDQQGRVVTTGDWPQDEQGSGLACSGARSCG